MANIIRINCLLDGRLDEWLEGPDTITRGQKKEWFNTLDDDRSEVLALKLISAWHITNMDGTFALQPTEAKAAEEVERQKQLVARTESLARAKAFGGEASEQTMATMFPLPPAPTGASVFDGMHEATVGWIFRAVGNLIAEAGTLPKEKKLLARA